MRLIFNYMSLHLKVKMQYKLSFFLTLIAQVLLMSLELFVISSLFQKFNLLNLYSIHELYFVFSVVWFGFSLAQMLGRGFDKFSNLLINGSFDLLLIRPQNIFLQIIGSDIFYEKISRIISSFILFIYSSTQIINGVNIWKILLLLLMLLGSFLIFFSIFIVGASICFYTIQGLEFVNIFTDGTKQLAQYPMGIYNKLVRGIFTYIVPICLINYYPIDYLRGYTNSICYLLLPLISCSSILLALVLFKHGMKHYKSSGS